MVKRNEDLNRFVSTTIEADLDEEVMKEHRQLKRKIKTVRKLLQENPYDEAALLLAKRYGINVKEVS